MAFEDDVVEVFEEMRDRRFLHSKECALGGLRMILSQLLVGPDILACLVICFSLYFSVGPLTMSVWHPLTGGQATGVCGATRAGQYAAPGSQQGKMFQGLAARDLLCVDSASP